MLQITSLGLVILWPLFFNSITKSIFKYIICLTGKIMKKKFLRILNRYSLLYLPTGWVLGLAVIFIAYEPITVLYFLSLFVLGIFGFLIFYTSNRDMVDESYNVSDYQYSIIEFYSDYWLGCTASKFIVDEFKKKNPDVFFVSINASKQKDHKFIERYKLNNTPTYVLINNKGEKIGRRVGTFYPKYFENKIV